MEGKYDVTFGEALEALRQGRRVRIPGWKGHWVVENGIIMAHLAEGGVEKAKFFNPEVLRTDWIILDD